MQKPERKSARLAAAAAGQGNSSPSIYHRIHGEEGATQLNSPFFASSATSFTNPWPEISTKRKAVQQIGKKTKLAKQEEVVERSSGKHEDSGQGDESDMEIDETDWEGMDSGHVTEDDK